MFVPYRVSNVTFGGVSKKTAFHRRIVDALLHFSEFTRCADAVSYGTPISNCYGLP